MSNMSRNMKNKQSRKGTGSGAIISDAENPSNGLPSSISGMMAQHELNKKATENKCNKTKNGKGGCIMSGGKLRRKSTRRRKRRQTKLNYSK
jgi:hypothetical protein